MLPQLREPLNVDELKERDKLVRRIKRIRAGFVLDKNTYEHWNRTHPDGRPIDTSFFDKCIDWCDGKGPMPTREDF